MSVQPRIRAQAGLSLVELMIALVIGTLLILGVVQVFAASRAAYQLSEGLARVQENGRFAMDFLQRDIRMAGHFGCVNDQAHALNNPPGMRTTFAATPHPGLDYAFSIRGYEAQGTQPSAMLDLSDGLTTGGDDYSPALPTEIASAASNRIDGSDIIVLRYLAPEGVPVTAIGGTAIAPVFHFDPARWNVLRSGADNPGLYGVADCLNATVFQANSVDPVAGTVTVGAAPVNASPDFTQLFTAGQTTLYRAESVVYYVGMNGSGVPALYRLRFQAAPGGGLASDPQELVEGIENLQIIYGVDRELSPSSPPSGFIDKQLVASHSILSGQEEGWRRVGSVQVAVLASSPGRAAVAQASEDAALLMGGGVLYTTPEDGRYRAVYQSTIALRNRLYGN